MKTISAFINSSAVVVLLIASTSAFGAGTSKMTSLPTTVEQFKKEFVHGDSGDNISIPKEYLGGKVQGLDRVAYPEQLIAQLEALDARVKATCNPDSEADLPECDFSLTETYGTPVRVIYTSGGFTQINGCPWVGHKDIVLFTLNGKDWYSTKTSGIVSGIKVAENSQSNDLFIFASDMVKSNCEAGPLTIAAARNLHGGTTDLLNYVPAQVLGNKIFGN